MFRLFLFIAVIASSACEPRVSVEPSERPEPRAVSPDAARPGPPPVKKEVIIAPSREHLRLEKRPDDASGYTWHLMDGDEPAAVEGKLLDRLETASHAALLHDNHVLLWQEGDVVFAEALGSGEESKLITLFPGADVAELYVAPSPTRVVLVTRNTERPDYGVKLFALDVAADGTLARKRRFDLDPPPLIRCYARCAPAEVIFDAQGVVRYLVKGGPDDPGDHAGPPVYETISIR